MARRSSRRRSYSRSKGRKSSGRRSSSGKGLPIIPLALAAGGAYLLWQHIQAAKATAASNAATAAVIAAAQPEQNLLPSLT